MCLSGVEPRTRVLLPLVIHHWICPNVRLKRDMFWQFISSNKDHEGGIDTNKRTNEESYNNRFPEYDWILWRSDTHPDKVFDVDDIGGTFRGTRVVKETKISSPLRFTLLYKTLVTIGGFYKTSVRSRTCRFVKEKNTFKKVTFMSFHVFIMLYVFSCV